MKKTLLLATSALVLMTAAASAQSVSINGDGRAGLQFIGGLWNQENRLRLAFTVETGADSGLTFGAWSMAHIDSGATGVFSGARVWVEAGGARLIFGNSDGALALAGTSHGWLGGCMVGYEGGQLCGDAAGLLTVAHQEVTNGAGLANLTVLTYSMGDTTAALSHQRGGDTEVGVRTSFDAFTVAAGYSTAGNTWTVSGHYNGGNWGIGALVADVAGATNYAISGTANVGGGTAYLYVGREFGANAFGLSYSYDLGGGAAMTVGGERVGATTTGSVGVSFTF